MKRSMRGMTVGSLLLLLACMLTGAGCGKKKETFSAQNFFFDTVISIRFESDGDGEELMEGCMQICRDLEGIFSRTDEKSELYALNHRSAQTVAVSDELSYLTKEALKLYERTGGKFDPTIAPLSDLWDFKSGEAVLPDPARIAEAQRKVDASKVSIEGNTISFASPETMLDLGALVKGYAADRLSAYLKENGVTSGLINLGGNVLAIGEKEAEGPWKIGIQKPFANGELIDTVSVIDQTVVSSGVYERCFEKDGVIYHHILDPESGYPVQNGLWGVTIVCDSSLLGDELSTACLLLGKEKGAELIKSQEGVRALFVDDQLDVTEVTGKDG